MERKVNRILIENAKLLKGKFRNFSGRVTDCNREGYRSFCLEIDDEDYVNKLKEDGWNVKMLPPMEDGDKPTFYIPVRVNFKYKAPKVVMVTHKNQTELDEESIGTLDTADIVNVDLIVVPSIWNVNGKSGVKAYLKTMYVTIEEDELEEKYSYLNRKQDDAMF